MTYNIYTGTNYTLDQEETIKKVIANRPVWNSARNDMLHTACYGSIQEGDLFYFRSNGAVGEFVGFAHNYDHNGEPLIGVKYHEQFATVKKGVIYQYTMSSIDSVFYKVPYFWIEGIPIYEGAVVYGVHNDQKYTVKDGWLIPESHLYCKNLCNSIEDYSSLTTKSPKKEYWIAFQGKIALDKVDTQIT